MTDYKRVTFTRMAMSPSDLTYGSGRRQVTLFTDPAVVGDKAAREACEAIHNLLVRLGELQGVRAEAIADVERLTKELDAGALSGNFGDLAERLTAARARLVTVNEQYAAAERARPVANQAYVDAISAATAWRTRLVKERAEWGAKAMEHAKAALVALQRAEDARTVLAVVDNPYAPIRSKSSPADAAAEPILTEIAAHLRKETP